MRLYHEREGVTLWQGDATDVAQHLEPGSVQTVVTSPPYWGLRDYEVEGQLGAEHDVRDYIANLVVLLGEVGTVLADDGVLWLNLGDTYARNGGRTGVGPNARVGNTRLDLRGVSDGKGRRDWPVPVKSLVGVPWRVALELIDDGWTLRSDVIWAKPNATPESVTDRPTRSHEHLFMFTKGPRYYYDAAAVAEPASTAGTIVKPYKTRKADGQGTDLHQHPGAKAITVGETRNRRDVWSIPTSRFPGAHFATFPADLPRVCILAASRPGDLVLDPFSGAGTTGMVAREEGRRYAGIDLNVEYLDLSLNTRLKTVDDGAA